MAGVATLALAAGVPIAAAFALLVGLRWSAARSMAVGWVLASVLGLALWEMDPTWWAAAALTGALDGLNIVLIVFGAVLLMNYLEVGGAIATIRWFFRGIEADRRIQLLLIGVGFETIIEGAAGFGTPGALAAPLFVGLGFPPLAAAVFGLFFNAPNPQFGAAGTPIIGGVGSMGEALGGADPVAVQQAVAAWTGVVTGLTYVFWGLLGVFLLLYWFGAPQERSLRGAARATRPVVPFALAVGTLAGLVQWAVAWFVGPALPDIAAGFAVLGVGVLLADRDVLVPADPWSFPPREAWSDAWLGGLGPEDLDGDDPSKEMPVLLAWTPYLVVGAFLLVTRWPTLDLVAALKAVDVSASFAVAAGTQTWTLEYLYLPGTMPFLPVAVGTGLLYGLDREETVAAWRASFRQIGPAAVTLLVAVSLTRIMIASATNGAGYAGMMAALSTVLAEGAGPALPMISPWIGALGTFVTGSNTTSDVLFNALQYAAAEEVGVSGVAILAVQNVGGGVGNMVSVLNVAAICGVVGIAGREGDILRKVVVPTILFALFAGVVGTAVVYGLAPAI